MPFSFPWRLLASVNHHHCCLMRFSTLKFVDSRWHARFRLQSSWTKYSVLNSTQAWMEHTVVRVAPSVCRISTHYKNYCLWVYFKPLRLIHTFHLVWRRFPWYYDEGDCCSIHEYPFLDCWTLKARNVMQCSIFALWSCQYAERIKMTAYW